MLIKNIHKDDPLDDLTLIWMIRRFLKYSLHDVKPKFRKAILLWLSLEDETCLLRGRINQVD